ncbi:MAG: hypothetical protein KGL39_31255 [Patescibacteria group bacterium]|nr:hypothetical protein [Patescibacteria group bacterium]
MDTENDFLLCERRCKPFAICPHNELSGLGKTSPDFFCLCQRKLTGKSRRNASRSFYGTAISQKENSQSNQSAGQLFSTVTAQVKCSLNWRCFSAVSLRRTQARKKGSDDALIGKVTSGAHGL